MIPASSGSNGQTQTICTLNVSVVGNYEDAGIAHWLGNFGVQTSTTACHTKTLLELIPNPFGNSGGPGYNLFAFTMAFTFTLTDQNGINHCGSSTGGVCTVDVSIPAAQTSYPFTGGTAVNNLIPGTYTITLKAPYPLGGLAGSTSFTEVVNVAQDPTS